MKNPFSLLRYLRFLIQTAGSIGAALRVLRQPDMQLSGYPNNHNYKLGYDAPYPSFELFERWNVVREAIPEQTTSMLDMACCRGYYLIEGMREFPIRHAVGVDVDKQFIQESRQAAAYLNQTVAFDRSDLDTQVKKWAQHGKTFDVILLTGAYHYFYWSEEGANHKLRSHEDILERLALLCNNTLIISARLELQHLPANLIERARKSPRSKNYTTQHFLDAAAHWFDVSIQGSLGRYPLFVMKKRHDSNASHSRMAL